MFEDVPLAVRPRLWFHRVRGRAHFGEDVRQWLNATCPGRQIGCLVQFVTSSVAGSNTDRFIPVETLMEQV
jgi:hypothetical protein